MRKHFLTGLALLLPAIITVWIAAFVIDLFTKPFLGMMTSLLETLQVSHQNLRFLHSKEILLHLSRLLILLVLSIAIIAVGWLTQWYLVNQLIRLGDGVVHRIPMVNNVYKATQEVMKTLFTEDSNGKKTPVLVPFPRLGCFTIGLSTGSYSAQSSPLGVASISVLIIGTPNPSAGFVLLYPAEEVKFLDMSVEEAVKCIISCASLQKQLRVKEATIFCEPQEPA